MPRLATMPRISDPPPYEYPLWAEHGTPAGYYWLVERRIDSEFSFRLRLIVQQPFSGNARLALALSLRKWVVLAASLECLAKWLGPAQLIHLHDGGWDTCALCMRYAFAQDAHCSLCPIFAETGERLCSGTPYADWRGLGSAPIGELQAVADREVVFLQQLTAATGGYLEDRSWPPKTS